MIRRRLTPNHDVFLSSSTALWSPSSGDLSGTGSSTCIGTSSSLLTTRRHTLHYASKTAFPEMRQPDYLHDKRHGVFSYEPYVARPRRSQYQFHRRESKHMNLWETDMDASNNRFYRHYYNMQEDVHRLLARPHYNEADHVDRRLADSAYELKTDQRFLGAPRPAITNAYFEPAWNQVLYRRGAHGSAMSDPKSELTASVLGPELMALRDLKSEADGKAWWARLAHLIQEHYLAVGNLPGETYKCRNIQVVHQFFVTFHESMSNHEFQDRYLKEYLYATRPKELDDLFGIFLEMEANYINEEHCPRCSLPLATTKFCGEGEPDTPFRKHRGRWAPHQEWGKEWYDVVCRRAEALWYRSVEDPLFGGPLHTQRQADALMNVYVKTKQRGKAVTFLTTLRGSREYLEGSIVVSAKMQEQYDSLLDHTAHPHVATAATSVSHSSNVYLGESHVVPVSPTQIRLDLEKSKFRRMQKEEGVVRLPPKGWKIDVQSIVPYKVVNGKIVNWREVKASIEASFLADGLPQEAYTSREWREILYLTNRIQTQDERRAAIEAELEADKKKISGSASEAKHIVFPDAEGYRLFDTSDASIQAFHKDLRHGQRVIGVTWAFPRPEAVPVTNSLGSYNVDTRSASLKLFGDFAYGDVLSLTPHAKNEEEALVAMPRTIVVLGVNESGTESERALIGVDLKQTTEAIVIGKDLADVHSRWSQVTRVGRGGDSWLGPADALMTATEEFEGQIVGVRKGQLYAQWSHGVAVPLGTKSLVAQLWQFKPHPSSSSAPASASSTSPLVEPPSWNTPFRNDWSHERLEEIRLAPWTREKWVSLIRGKYTPKVKKFGYTQHIRQDDHVTKEYQDRLTSRQYFHSPQSFEVLPDRADKSVSFGFKDSNRVVGLPGVDRQELDRAWGNAEVLNDAETASVEQCLKDISGNRPGNFVKTPSEKSSLKLNESWWTAFQTGWERHNEEQMMFAPTERQLIDGAKLPFQGKLPAFGTSQGIAERVRDVTEDFGKGFGLGPHQRSPGASKGPFDTLGMEAHRAKQLGYDTVVARLFREKLGKQDLHAWAAQVCQGANINPKHLLLSLKSWQRHGQAPSLLLRRVLAVYLKPEIASFNETIPDGVPKLTLSTNEGTLAPLVDNVWAAVDSTAHALDYLANQRSESTSSIAPELGIIPAMILKAEMSGIQSFDEQYLQVVQQEILFRFREALSQLCNKGVSQEAIGGNASGSGREGTSRSAAFAQPLVRGSELSKLLRANYGISLEELNPLLAALSNHSQVAIGGGGAGRVSTQSDFAVPASLILSWKGENMGVNASTLSANAHVSASFGQGGDHGRGGPLNTQTSQQQNRSLLMSQVLDDLSFSHEGFAMDVQYHQQQWLRNATLKSHFWFAFSGLLPENAVDQSRIEKTFQEYLIGNYVPTVQDALIMFNKFLRRTGKSPAVVRDFVEVTTTATGSRTPLISPFPAEERAKLFSFDNVASEMLKTESLFEKLKSRMQLEKPVWLSNGKLLSYATNADAEFVQVTPQADHGLVASLQGIAPTDVAAELRDRLNSPVQACALFNAFLRRTLPLLDFYSHVLEVYMGPEVSRNKRVADQSQRSLQQILTASVNDVVQREFQQNAERYWRSVLDGNNRDAGTTGAETAAGGGSSMTSGGGRSGVPRQRVALSAKPPSSGRGGQQQQSRGSSQSPSQQQRGGFQPQQQQQQRGANNRSSSQQQQQQTGTKKTTMDAIDSLLKKKK